MNAQAPIVRGFDIRLQRIGSAWMNEKIHAWSPAGTLPSEWSSIVADPTVVQAVCYFSTEARKQSHKRKILAFYDRQAAAC